MVFLFGIKNSVTFLDVKKTEFLITYHGVYHGDRTYTVFSQYLLFERRTKRLVSTLISFGHIFSRVKMIAVLSYKAFHNNTCKTR